MYMQNVKIDGPDNLVLQLIDVEIQNANQIMKIQWEEVSFKNKLF